MAPAAPTALVCTVVHAPGSVPESLWTVMRRAAGGVHRHELRIAFEGATNPSGAQLEAALRTWVESITDRDPSSGGALSTAIKPAWVAVLDDRPLKDHAPVSPSIHPGMVVALLPRSRRTPPVRCAASPLRLCISSGPDAGWMVRIPRGVHVLGRGTAHRGTADIRINDPRLDRTHASVHVGATRAKLVRSGAASRPLAIDDPVAVGGSRVELVQNSPPSAPGNIWPLPPVSIAEPPPSGRHRAMLLMSLAPLIVGIVLVLVTGMWIFLLFSAVSALVAIGTLLGAHRQRRRFRRAVRSGATVWARQRRDLLNSPGDAIRALRARSHSRASSTPGQDQLLVVTVGEARQEAELDCPGQSDPPVHLPELSVCTAAALTLHASQYTRISGAPRDQLSVLRWILAQLTQHRGEVPEILLVAGAEESGGARSGEMLDTDELRDHHRVNVVSSHSLLHAVQSSSRPSSTPVLIAPVPLAPVPLQTALDAGWHVVSAAATFGLRTRPRRSPEEQVLSTSADGWEVNLASGEVHRIEAGAARRVATGLTFDGLSRRTLHEHLRLGLARIPRTATTFQVPARFSASLPIPLMARGAQLDLETRLGRGAITEELLDLVEDGPHILLAGTTGAGKSELLKSMLLGWAASYGPGEVNFLLFDFKGGSSFQHLARLEHSLGLVTDLSQAQADRALEGVRSELVRRERLFLEAGATDYSEFRRTHPDRPLARILVVFDEFRIFTQELPAAMGELMRLATLGRSLGLHLILATQRPQGVVTAEIRANIGSIICLRLRNDEEARELVGTTEPARIPRGLPGRGILQRPGESPVAFHAVQLRHDAAKLWARPERSPLPLEAEGRESTPHLVSALDAHMRRLGLHRPHTPLCPALPAVLDAPLLAPETLFGLVDDPAQQSQRPLRLDLDEGVGVALLGETGSGGSVALNSLVQQLLSGPREVHVYLMDGDHSLEQFHEHPRVGSWITTDHPQEAQHLVSELHRLVVRRRSGSPRVSIPLLLLVSGHPRWHGMSHLIGLAGLEHDLGVLIGEGAGFGMSVVVAGGRELALGKLGSRLQTRVYLPYGVSEDVRLLWPKLRVTDRIPGRGVLVTPDLPPPGLTVQLVTGTHEEQPVGREIREGASRKDGRTNSMLRVHPLPEAVDLPVLAPGSAALSLGLRQFTHSPALLEEGSWQVGLILGAAQTGKTNALRVVASQRRSWTLADLRGAEEHEGHQAAAPSLLLVDDADRCTPAQHRAIEGWLESGGSVLATARPHPNVFGQLPWSYRARGGSANFVLSPVTRSQGDAFGISLPVLPRIMPGRAAWISAEGPKVIQWWKQPEAAGGRD